MKFPGYKWRHWHRSRQKDQLSRSTRKIRAARKSGKDSQDNSVTITRLGRTIAAYSRQSAQLPSDMRLLSNPDEVASSLYDIRRTFRLTTPFRRQVYDTRRARDPYRPMGKPRRIGAHLSFENIQELDAAAALVLAAEFERANQKLGAVLPAVNIEAWAPEVRRYLEELGFTRLLKIHDPETDNEPTCRPMPSGRIVLPMKSGDRITSDVTGSLTLAVNALLGGGATPEAASQIFHMIASALNDCVSNVFEHAYPEAQYSFPHIRRWWLNAVGDPIHNNFTIVFYDQGITIPGHLALNADHLSPQHQTLIERWKNGAASCCEVLEQAIETQMTSTGKANRGRGLRRITDVLSHVTSGSVSILSRKAYLTYMSNGTKSVRTLSHSIGGTLLVWEVQL